MKTKYIVLIIVIIALVLIGVFFYRGEEVKEEKEEENVYLDYETYSNINWGFEAKYPKEWKEEVSQDEPEQFSIGFVSPSEDESDLVFEISLASSRLKSLIK